MSLRVQLFCVGLLTLALPWAGYRYVQELEGALRDGLEQSLLASADTMASALQLQPLEDSVSSADPDVETTIYAHPLDAPPNVDGYRNDWNTAADTARPLADSGLYWAGLHGRSIYLFISVRDDDLIYQDAPTQRPYGDRVLVRPGGTAEQWLLLHRSGPGRVRSQLATAPLFAPTGLFEDRVSGYWRETSLGYDIEVRLPLEMAAGRLGIAVVDVDRNSPADAADNTYAVNLITSWRTRSSSDLGSFVYRPPDLDIIGRRFLDSGKRMRIVDSRGWVMFDGGELVPLAETFIPSSMSLTERVYRFILARRDPPYQELERPPGRLADGGLRMALQGQNVAAWYARGPDASAVVAAAVPIQSDGRTLGAVILEQGSDSILTLTNAALVRLMGFTLLASMVVAIGLLSYATLLSIRVQRLARAADTALGPKGEINATLPGRNAGDEIGDLARSFADLLTRLRDYTDYLTTLKAKLAHELRTPLAVVSTSLDNLEREPHESHQEPYLARLREGTNRLDAILAAMSEATLIERAVADTEPEDFAIDAVVTSCVGAYTDIYDNRTFRFDCHENGMVVRGSADLTAQMLDKLIDNAVTFSPPASTIDVALIAGERELELCVTNRGPPLPGAMRNQLFDSLVSVRDEASLGRHLGLGLYIVALIVDFHGGSIDADDLEDGSGVRFRVTLPRVR